MQPQSSCLPLGDQGTPWGRKCGRGASESGAGGLSSIPCGEGWERRPLVAATLEGNPEEEGRVRGAP